MEDYAIGAGTLSLQLEGMDRLKRELPEMYEAINECSAFINHRSIAAGRDGLLSLAYES